MASWPSSLSTSSSSSSARWKHDVFLSFRGEDTRKNFTDHLYQALKKKGIDTFRDDEKLESGKDIAPEFLKEISESRFAIVVFSRNYANSTWCQQELARIADCKKEKGQTVLPVFYHVDPSDVRKQGGDFKTAFDNHERDFNGDAEKLLMIKQWRQALAEITSVSGWDLKDKLLALQYYCN